LGIIFVVLTVVLACSIPALMRWGERRSARRWTKGDDKAPPGNGEKGTGGLALPRQLWGVEDIRDGVLFLTGGRHRAIFRISFINAALMSEEEQTVVEDALMSCVMGISFPVQFVSLTSPVNVQRTVADLAARAWHDHSPVRQMYAEQLCRFLSAVQEAKSILTREIYAVVTSEQPDGREAERELEHRGAVLAAGLERAGIAAERLSSEAIVDLLHHQFNRGKRFRPSDAVAAGGLDLVVTGRGVPYQAA
jgi:hypothetical protein